MNIVLLLNLSNCSDFKCVMLFLVVSLHSPGSRLTWLGCQGVNLLFAYSCG